MIMSNLLGSCQGHLWARGGEMSWAASGQRRRDVRGSFGPEAESEMTFSIVARCAQTGRLGVAVATASVAVGARCPFAAAGVGAVVTQNRTHPLIGPRALALLGAGAMGNEAARQAAEG